MGVTHTQNQPTFSAVFLSTPVVQPSFTVPCLPQGKGKGKGKKKGGARKEKVTAEMKRAARKTREAQREEKAAASRKDREEIFEVRPGTVLN